MNDRFLSTPRLAGAHSSPLPLLGTEALAYRKRVRKGRRLEGNRVGSWPYLKKEIKIPKNQSDTFLPIIPPRKYTHAALVLVPLQS